MASIAIKVADRDIGVEHFYTFDHLGREIPMTGYEGGLQRLQSNTLSADTLRNVIAGTIIVENAFPVGRPNHGSFGYRTGRYARRVMPDAG